MSYVKREIENTTPELFGPRALPPKSDQACVDYEQFLFAVEAEENAILTREGCWYVGGIYYANAEDASMHRTWLAERTVNARAKLRVREFGGGLT